MHARARGIGAAVSRHAGAGDRAIVLLSPSIDYVASLLGCMCSGAVAVPIAPARRRQTSEHLAAVLRDASASVVVTTRDLVASVETECDEDDSIRRPAIIVTDDVVDADDWRGPDVQPDGLALLQYTSGSTGSPKGVALTHGNLIANQKMIQTAFTTDETITCVSWLPQYHDMGLIGDTIQPLFLGATRVFMPHQAFLERPIRWLQAISRHANVMSGGPDFAYDYCVRRITDEQCAGLDLSSWQLAYSGSEPVRAQTLERFTRRFAPYGFRPETLLPCYGLAEASLLVTGGPGPDRPTEITIDAEDLTSGTVTPSASGKRLVGCGSTPAGTEVRIVDPVTLDPCEPDEIGEIWVSGPSIAVGYWQREEATNRTLRAQMPGDETHHLRTGDLGFLREGELFIVGRHSDTIIIRGRNLHPHDIEGTVQNSHAALEPHGGAAFGVERDGREALVVVQDVKRTARRNVDPAAVLGAVRRAVSEAHGVTVADLVLTRPGTVLKTTSGKIRRRAMHRRYLDGAIDRLETNGSTTPAPPPHADLPALLDWLRDYADRRLNSRLMDERKCIPPYVILDLGNRGLLGLTGPRSLGGLELGHRDTLRVFEQLGAIDQSLALFVGIHNVLGTGPILRSATPEARAELLPRLVAGRELAAFALTEPGAGSNPRAIATRAVATGNGTWRLYGTKLWSGVAAWAGVINVFAKLEGVNGDRLGSAAFAVRQGAAGLRHGDEAPTMGMRAIVQNTVHLEGVEVSQRDMLGGPGDGLAVAQEAMTEGRLAIAAACLGGMRRCAQLMHRYASRRTVGGERLGNNPVTLDRLGATTAAIAGLDALLGRLGDALDAGVEVPDGIYAAVKILAPELFWTAADHLVQMLGGRGYIETNEAPQMLRDARILRIFEGPTEAMAAYLGARLMNDEAGVVEFLATRLKAPLAARRLHETLAEAHATLKEADTPTRVRLRYRLGELAAWTVLAGALESGGSDRARRWAQSAVSAHEHALATPPVETALENVAAEVAGYASRIGDIEQSMAGEDVAVDPLLRRAEPPAGEAPSDSGEVESTVHLEEGPPPPPTAGTARSAAEIETFLRNWTAEHLDMRPEDVDPLAAFADLGADSVTAVELVIDLGGFVGRQLDDTLPWETPNIAAIAARLGSIAPSPPDEPAPDVANVADPHADDPHLAEIEVSLRQLEQRLGGS